MADPDLDKAIEALLDRVASESDRHLGHLVVPTSIPQELAYFYQRVGRSAWDSAVDPGTYALLDPTGVVAQSLGELGLFEADSDWPFLARWRAGKFFKFISLIYGDDIALFVDSSKPDPGRVVLLDHEGEGCPTLLGSSLGEWLNRFVANDCVEFAYFSGNVDDLAPDAARRFVRDHLLKNPHMEWAARRIEEWEPRFSERDRPLIWAEDRLVPLSEAAGERVQDLRLSNPTQAEFENVCRDGRCTFLILSDGTVSTIASIGELPGLTHLYLYGDGSVDLTPLATLPALRRVDLGGWKVRGLDKLIPVKTLERLELSREDIDSGLIDRGEVDRFRAARPDVAIDGLRQRGRRS